MSKPMDEVASAEASVERFREEFDKLQRALKKSITTEKILVTKCRELKAELVDKTMKLQWAYKLKTEDEKTIATLRKEVQKAWAVGDTAKEKEAAAQKVILQLKEEVLTLRTMVQELNKTVSKLSQDMEGPQRARVDNREALEDDGSTPFEKWKKANNVEHAHGHAGGHGHGHGHSHGHSHTQRSTRRLGKGRARGQSPVRTRTADSRLHMSRSQPNLASSSGAQPRRAMPAPSRLHAHTSDTKRASSAADPRFRSTPGAASGEYGGSVAMEGWGSGFLPNGGTFPGFGASALAAAAAHVPANLMRLPRLPAGHDLADTYGPPPVG